MLDRIPHAAKSDNVYACVFLPQSRNPGGHPPARHQIRQVSFAIAELTRAKALAAEKNAKAAKHVVLRQRPAGASASQRRDARKGRRHRRKEDFTAKLASHEVATRMLRKVLFGKTPRVRFIPTRRRNLVAPLRLI